MSSRVSKNWKSFLIVGLLLTIPIILILRWPLCKEQIAEFAARSVLVQAWVLIVVVLVTCYYAWQTRELVQIGKEQVDFDKEQVKRQGQEVIMRHQLLMELKYNGTRERVAIGSKMQGQIFGTEAYEKSREDIAKLDPGFACAIHNAYNEANAMNLHPHAFFPSLQQPQPQPPMLKEIVEVTEALCESFKKLYDDLRAHYDLPDPESGDRDSSA